MKPRATVIWAPGTNCHHEMLRAFHLAGADSRLVLTSNLASGREKLYETDLLGFPGGFSWGDHFGAGRMQALDLLNRLRDQLLEAKARRVPMIGVCNGFQVLVSAGLLPGGELGVPEAALYMNASANFEHWNHTPVCFFGRHARRCHWTSGLASMTTMTLPVAHGEGRLVFLENKPRNVVATYGSPAGVAAYPISPNGSYVAGICDDSGLVFGLMPHPERRIDSLHGGDWGLDIFRCGVEAVGG